MKGSELPFGPRLSKVLSFQQKTQADLAEALKVSRATVSGWCSGKIVPTAEKLQLISRALGVTTDYLLGTEQPMAMSAEFMRVHYDLMDVRHLSAREQKQRMNEVNEFVTYLRNRTKRSDDLKTRR